MIYNIRKKYTNTFCMTTMTTRLAHHVPIIKQSQVIPPQAGQNNFSAASPVAVDFDGDGELDAGAARKSGEHVANRQPGFCCPGHDACGNRVGRLKFHTNQINQPDGHGLHSCLRNCFSQCKGRFAILNSLLAQGPTAFYCTSVFERKEPNQKERWGVTKATFGANCEHARVIGQCGTHGLWMSTWGVLVV